MVPFYVIGKVQYVFASRHPRRHSARSFSVTSFPYLATSLPPYLLFSDFSPATHFRRSYRSENVQTCQRSDVLTSFTAKSLPFNLFADSHPLTPVTSDFYKNAGGRGHSRRFLSPKAFPCHTSENSPVSPLAATLMHPPASVANKRLTVGLSPLDATLTKNRGVHPSSQRALSLRAFPAVRTFKRFDVQTFQRVSQPSPFLSIIYALSYTTGDTYPLFFQSLAHSFHRDGGCTPLFPLWNSPPAYPPVSLLHYTSYFHTVTWNPFCKPFIFIFIRVMGGVPFSPGSRQATAYSLSLLILRDFLLPRSPRKCRS